MTDTAITRDERMGGRRALLRFRALAGTAALAVWVSQPAAIAAETIPSSTAVAIRDAGVRDVRGVYRAALCGRLASKTVACDEVLLRLPGESPATAPPPAEKPAAQRYRIAFVGGLFAECFEGLVRPFSDVERDLRSAGFTVDYYRVAGRGAAAQNAAILARHLQRAGDDPRPIIVFAYSKGLVDVLELMVRFPASARRIAAVVSVAGAANGSPLADDLAAIYRELAAAFPMQGCADGTGAEVTDLRRDTRIAWWAEHGDAVSVPLFALVAAPRADRVSPVMQASYRRLARIDARNDGNLLWQDQIPPRSRLLGYANADHWSIAVPLSQAQPKLSFLFRDDVPRTALVESAIEVVAWTLASEKSR